MLKLKSKSMSQITIGPSPCLWRETFLPCLGLQQGFIDRCSIVLTAVLFQWSTVSLCSENPFASELTVYLPPTVSLCVNTREHTLYTHTHTNTHANTQTHTNTHTYTHKHTKTHTQTQIYAESSAEGDKFQNSTLWGFLIVRF